MQNIIIRHIKESEIRSVFELVRNTLQVSYHDVYPVEAINYFEEYHSFENISKDAAQGYTVVAVINNDIVGTCTLLDSNIRRVFIRQEHQNKGIGKLVARKLEIRAILNKRARVNLSASPVSREFWESLGFKVQKHEYGVVKNGKILEYYEMEKELNNNIDMHRLEK